MSLLIDHGADVHQRAADRSTALTAALAAEQVVALQLLLAHGGDKGEEERWMGMDAVEVAETITLHQSTAVLQVLRAHESRFEGNILNKEGCVCVASWPGRYAKLWDTVVAKGKASQLSAAVVFLPEHTVNFGKHGTDRCYCEEILPHGCLWFQVWRENIELAVAKQQRLQVYFAEGRTGKVESWSKCGTDAMKRTAFTQRKLDFLERLPTEEKSRLRELPSQPRDDARGGAPGTERSDEEERLFVASLSTEELAYLEGHKGLGNSQKAEVAWLEKMGYAYEEVDVRDFVL
eukprot:g2305.t1